MEKKYFEMEVSLLEVCAMLLYTDKFPQKLAVRVLKECFLVRAKSNTNSFEINTNQLARQLGEKQSYIWVTLNQMVEAGILKKEQKWFSKYSLCEKYETFCQRLEGQFEDQQFLIKLKN